VKAVPTYRAARLMRHALGGHERPIGLTISARFSPVIDAARPPTRANRACDRHRRERMSCLDRSSPGRPAGAITGNASGSRRGGSEVAGSALGRHHGARIRPPSRPPACRRNALGRHARHRPRAPARPAGQRGPLAWCRPTSACSPTPCRRARSIAF
jgi:hypothetical protein